MNQLKVDGWVKNLKHILTYCCMDDCLELHSKCDFDVPQACMKVLNRDNWWLEAGTKTKLRTFVQFVCRIDPQGLSKCNLCRNHPSLISRLKCGVLPLKLEVGRFNNAKIETRLCACCTEGVIETEAHFVNDCTAFENERKSICTQQGKISQTQRI